MKCNNCKKHKANDTAWIGQGSMLDWAHGNYTYWCDCCVLKAQIKHAKEILKGNLKKLKKLKCV